MNILMDYKKIFPIGFFLFASTSYADVYSGSVLIDSNRGPRPLTIVYKFDASNKSNIRGSVEFTRERGGPCWGPRSIDGSVIRGDEVILSAPPSPELDSLGCTTFDVVGKLDGETIRANFKVQGKPYEIVLTKQ